MQNTDRRGSWKRATVEKISHKKRYRSVTVAAMVKTTVVNGAVYNAVRNPAFSARPDASEIPQALPAQNSWRG